MGGRHVAIVPILALAAFPLAAEQAVEREGGSSRSESAGARHHSSDSGRSSDTARSSEGTRATSDSSRQTGTSASPAFASEPLTDAQRRHPRAGTGTGHRGGHGRVYAGRPYYYGYPYSRSYYYGRYPYWDYYGYWGYYGGYYPYSPYGRNRYYYRDTGSLRLLVDPSKTRVYVDGYYAGIVDDFDGIFQRLHVSPGRHEISLKLEGYRTHRVKVYVPSDHTIKFHYDMVRGSGEDLVEDLTAGDLEARDRDERDRDDGETRPDDRYARSDFDGEDGTLRLDIKPNDASVYVDGEFRGAAREARRLDLSPGRHRLEIVRPGFRTVEREVDVRPGKTTDISIDLDRS